MDIGTLGSDLGMVRGGGGGGAEGELRPAREGTVSPETEGRDLQGEGIGKRGCRIKGRGCSVLQ